MKSTDRPRSRCGRITAKTRSARSDGSAAVISSSSSSCGSRASARARSIIRSIGSGTSSHELVEVEVEVERAQPLVHRARDRPRSAAGSARPSGRARGRDPGRPARARSRAACAGEPMRSCFAVDATRAAVGRITPVSTLTSVLLPAPFAPSRACTSPGCDEQVGRAQRDHGAVALRQAARFEQESAVMPRAPRREGRRRPPRYRSARGATAPCSRRAVRRVRRPRLDLQPCAVRRRTTRRVVRLDVLLARRCRCPRRCGVSFDPRSGRSCPAAA